jgi:hypothetical protein
MHRKSTYDDALYNTTLDIAIISKELKPLGDIALFPFVRMGWFSVTGLVNARGSYS